MDTEFVAIAAIHAYVHTDIQIQLYTGNCTPAMEPDGTDDRDDNDTPASCIHTDTYEDVCMPPTLT